MSAEYSVGGILAVADAADNGDVRHPGMVADMLRAYAATLQAKPDADVVTNEDVAVARDAYNHTLNSQGTISQVKAMRAALESYALRRARQVPDEVRDAIATLAQVAVTRPTPFIKSAIHIVDSWLNAAPPAP